MYLLFIVVLFSSCVIKGLEPVACDIGTYSPVGVMDCVNCSIGYYCPAKSAHAQIPCPSGWYSLTEGLYRCLECPRGNVI